jgi:hypothetical protein
MWWESNGKKNLLLMLISLVLAASLPFLTDAITILGWRIPQPDMISDYSKAVAFAMGLFVLLVALPFPALEKRALLILWSVKCLVMLGLMLLYEWNYPLDAYFYFDMAQKHDLEIDGTGFGRGTENLIALLWHMEHNVFRTYSYHSYKVFLSFVGLAGIYAFYRGLKHVSERVNPKLLLQIGLFPSILFWTSILGKDPINSFAICLFFYSALSIIKSPKPIYFLIMAFSLWLTALIRVWLVPILLVPLLIYQIVKIRSKIAKLVLLAVLLVGGMYSMRYAGKSLAIESAEALTGQVNQVSRNWNRGGGATDIPRLDSIGAMIQFLPIGMATALFRPVPGEVMNLFGLIAGLENLFLLYLLFRSIRNYYRGEEFPPIVTLGIAFVICWSVLYAFLSPQNLGAAVRFKLQVLPMILVTLLAMAYPSAKVDSTPHDHD